MEKNIFFRMMVAIAVIFTVALTGCTYEEYPEDIKTPVIDPQDPTVSAVLNYAGLSHNWKYSDGLVVDCKKCQANISLTEKGVPSTDEINQDLPFRITWDKLERMVRSIPEFKLEEKSVSEKYLSATTTNNHLDLATYTQSFVYNFDGLTLTLSTSNQEVKYNKHSGIELPNCLLDSIVFIKQRNEVMERFLVRNEPYLRTKVTLVFAVFRHHTDDNIQHVDSIYPNFMVDAPETPNEKEDMFNGAIPINGTEKLFLKTKVDNNTSIYTSQRDVYEYWSVSGKKRVTYSVDLEVKQWIDDAQKAWKVPNIQFGNPKIEQTENVSEAYTKSGNNDYEFEKTTSDWSYTWNYANDFRTGTHSSAEKAWKLFNGLRVMEMPSSKHMQNYDKYTYDDATDKEIDGKTYQSYASVIYFNGSYNNDAYDLNQKQEFLVEKANVLPPAPVDPLISETIQYEFENNGNKIISRIIWHRDYKESGTRDSIAVQELIRDTKIDGDKRFVRDNNYLGLKKANDVVSLSEKTNTDKETGHVITTKVIRYGFDFDFFNYNIEETYQTAYTMYNGQQLNFIAPVPKVDFSGIEKNDIGEITEDGKTFNRTRYALKFRETYEEALNTLAANVDIDVEKVNPKDEYVSHTVTKDFDPTTGISTITFHIVGTLSQRDSVVTQKLAHQVIVDGDKNFIRPNNTLTYQQMATSTSENSRVENGNHITTITTDNTFKFNVGNSVVKTVYETAYTIFRGERVDFISPKSTVIFAGSGNPVDMGIVNNNGKEYNRTQYTLTYQESYNDVQTSYSNKFNLDVEKEVIVNPTIDQTIDLGKTKQFGRLSWAWDADGKPFISGTIITTTGVISFWNGGYNFHEMDVNTITKALGNSLYIENPNQYLIPAYINIEAKPNKHWVYKDVNGEYRDEVYGTFIEKLEDVTLNQPFFGEPSEDSETYQISESNGTVRVKVVYKGKVLFNEVLSK